MTDQERTFVRAFKHLAKMAYENAVDKGFRGEGRNVTQASMLINIHAEISEAWEAVRHGNPPDDKIPEFSGLEAELGDAIIRILDMAHAEDLRVAEAILAKMVFNQTRTHRHGGKLF